MDDLALSNDALRQNLDELEFLNSWLGSHKLVLKGLAKIIRFFSKSITQKKIRIADLGCGGGDVLRAIEKWAQKNNILVELFGFDANPFMIDYAKNKSQNCAIEYQVMDILSPEFARHNFDIICISTFGHHLSDETLIQLFQQLKQQTNYAILFNDLHRHWLSYYSIRILSRVLNFSYLAQHDAPVSVLRAFKKQDFISMMKRANISSYQIKWAWAFRWELIIF